MVKKSIGITLAVLAVAASALAPSSASADLVPLSGHQCKTQTDIDFYCVRLCVVPRVVGRSLVKAEQLLKAHDCRVGKITKREIDKDRHKKGKKGKGDKRERHREKGVVVKQNPKPSKTPYLKGQKVDLVVGF